MTREPLKLTTPSGKELQIIPYLTARERNELRNTYLAEMTTEIDPANPNQSKITGLKGTTYEKREHTLIRIGVTSYAGNMENILDRLLDEKPEEYDFVIEELDKALTGGLTQPK
jgi:hypothetical protein